MHVDDFIVLTIIYMLVELLNHSLLIVKHALKTFSRKNKTTKRDREQSIEVSLRVREINQMQQRSSLL